MGDRAKSVAWVALIALLAWPSNDHVAQRGLDPSWRLGTTFAHLQGLTYGDDVIFNYGPLGFVTSPLAGGGRWFYLGLIGSAALVLAFGGLTYLACRVAGASVRWSAASAGALALFAPTELPIVELVVLAASGVLILHVWDQRWPHPALWVLPGALAATLMLVKVSAGPVMLLVVLLAAVAGPLVVRSLASVVAGFVGALVVGWLLLGQPIADLVAWLRGAASIATGHTAAMSVGAGGVLWQYAALSAVLMATAALVFLWWSEGPSLEGRRRLEVAVCAAILVVITWFFVKQGFVRRDGHVRIFFFAALWFAVVYLSSRRPNPTSRRIGQAVVVLCVACFVGVSGLSYLANLNPGRPVAAFVRSADLAVRPSRASDESAEANDRARAVYQMPQEILDLIGSAPVHIDPHEVTVAWVYGLNWSPVPTLQRYIDYTPHLDAENARRLRHADGPRFVLRSNDGHIDGRYPLAEGPAYLNALLCDYRPVFGDLQWQLFERSESRCRPPVEIVEVRLGAGEEFEIPVAAGGETAIFVAIEYDQNLFDRFVAAALKPPSSPQVTLDGVQYRMIAATSATPALIGLPEVAGWGSAISPLASPVRVLSVDRPATITVSTQTITADTL